MVMGPQGLGGNHPRNIEYNVDWITKLIEHMRSNNVTRIEPKSESVKFWMKHVKEKSGMALMNNVDSWMTGINSNVTSKNVRIVGGRYGGSVQSYRGLCDKVATENYKAMTFS